MVDLCLKFGGMQSVFNTVKGTALGVAEYLTPVLKVRASCRLKKK